MLGDISDNELNETWEKIQKEIPHDKEKQIEELEEVLNCKLAAMNRAVRVDGQTYFKIRAFVREKKNSVKKK